MVSRRLSMERVFPVKPISDLRKEQAEMLSLLDETPILLTNRGSAAGILVNVDHWNKTANELARLRRIIQGDKAFAEMSAGNYVELEPEDMLALGQ